MGLQCLKVPYGTILCKKRPALSGTLPWLDQDSMDWFLFRWQWTTGIRINWMRKKRRRSFSLRCRQIQRWVRNFVFTRLGHQRNKACASLCPVVRGGPLVQNLVTRGTDLKNYAKTRIDQEIPLISSWSTSSLAWEGSPRGQTACTCLSLSTNSTRRRSFSCNNQIPSGIFRFVSWSLIVHWFFLGLIVATLIFDFPAIIGT